MGNQCCVSRGRGTEENNGYIPENNSQDLDQNLVTHLQANTFTNRFKNESYLRRFGHIASVSVFREHASGELRIIKSIAKSEINSTKAQKFFQELSIEKNFKHPAICRIREIMEDTRNYYFVREFVAGGDIIKRILASKISIAQIFRSLISAVEHYHSNKIVIGDIKPQNLIHEKATSTTKFSDFRCRKIMPDAKPVFLAPEVVFTAPELIDGGIEPTKASDMWSCGAILYLLCTGKLPFESETTAGLFEQIKKGKWNFEDDIWKSVPEGPRDIISKLMILDPIQRATAEMILKDDWVQGKLKDQLDFSLGPKALENLRTYWVDRSQISSKMNILSCYKKAKNEFFYEMTTLLSTKFMKPAFFDKLTKKCKELDVANEGRLSKKLLVKKFKELFGQNVSDERMQKIIDFNNTAHDDGDINYSEMVKSAQARQNEFLKEKINQIFELLDKDGTKTMDTSLFLESLMFDGRDWPVILDGLHIKRKGTISKGDFAKLIMQAIFTNPNSMIIE